MLEHCPRKKFVPMRAYEHEENESNMIAGEVLELDGFVELLLRISESIFSEVDGEADMGLSLKFDRLISEYLLPHAELMERSDVINEDLKDDAGKLIQKYMAHFKAIFKYFCKQGSVPEKGGKFSTAHTISVYQYLMFVKECKLSLRGFSYNLCLETFVTVNQDVSHPPPTTSSYKYPFCILPLLLTQ